jgi:hypothetical protein
MRTNQFVTSSASTGIAVLPLFLFSFGCATSRHARPSDAQEEMLTLLMPDRINIVEPFTPFTRATRFDLEGPVNGIELFVQAVNRFDDPGLMVVGSVRIELFEYVPASADHRGRHLEQWEVNLTTPKHLYEFRLGLNPDAIPRADRYILSVTYVSPFEERLTDLSTVDFGEATARPSDGFLSMP